MRASLAGLLAACALFGIPRLVGELREYRKDSPRPAPAIVSVPPESQPAANAAPLPKAPDAPAPPKQAPMLVSLQRDASPPAAIPTPTPAVAGTAPPSAPNSSPVKETDLIPAIQKELTRLGLYDGPITDKWNRPVRSAARDFFRRTGTRVRSPQPTAELLAALHAADFAKKQAASPREDTRAGEKPAPAGGATIKVTAPDENAATLLPATPVPAAPVPSVPVPAVTNQDYLPPWMTAQTDQA